VSAELRPGAELGPSGWLEITQARIDAFAEATDDRQAIHVDPEFAATGPFGTTVAHGLLTLSLIVPLWAEVAEPHPGTTINYGLNRVRFPAPVPSGSRIRAHFRVESVEAVAGGTQATIAATVEREGHDKPVCVAELLLRFLA
jgi:acyl dehydratase